MWTVPRHHTVNPAKPEEFRRRAVELARSGDKPVAETLIANARNEYLHGGSASFAPIPEGAWWPSFWGQASILIHALDYELSDFVGEQRVQTVEAYLAQNKKNITDRANMRIERARQLYLQVQAATLSAPQLAEWEARKRHLPAYLEKSSEDRVACPACGISTATWLTGQEIEGTDVEYEQISQDDFDVIITLTIGTEYFACETCGLELDGAELIDVAGLPPASRRPATPATYLSRSTATTERPRRTAAARQVARVERRKPLSMSGRLCHSPNVPLPGAKRQQKSAHSPAQPVTDEGLPDAFRTSLVARRESEPRPMSRT